MKGLQGNQLGRYRLGREIGRGGMGTVYEATDLDHDRTVAVKVARMPSGNERSARRLRKLFVNEARAAALLRHPNIVAVLDAGYDGDFNYLVMEHVRGGRTLHAHCARDSLLPVATAVEILAKCANALGYAHTRGIVHRDVKPRNVLLTPDGDVKVTDFGVALIDRHDTEQTQVMGNVGSPSYMAPEQIRGEAASVGSDIFALGVIGYELFTGTHPFRAATVAAVAQRIARELHRPLLELRPELPPLLSRVIDHALTKHPMARYGNALEMAADLYLILEDIRHQPDEAELNLQPRLARCGELAFFGAFRHTEVREVVSSGEWLHFGAGEKVIVEGGESDVFFILVEGSVGVWRGEMLLDTLAAGSSFGEIGFVLEHPRTASIVARESVVALRVPLSAVAKMSDGCRYNIEKAFLRTMASRLLRALDALSVRAM